MYLEVKHKARYMEIYTYLEVKNKARYTEISMYLTVKHKARYMEISMYLAVTHKARYMEIYMYLAVKHISQHIFTTHFFADCPSYNFIYFLLFFPRREAIQRVNRDLLVSVSV